MADEMQKKSRQGMALGAARPVPAWGGPGQKNWHTDENLEPFLFTHVYFVVFHLTWAEFRTRRQRPAVKSRNHLSTAAGEEEGASRPQVYVSSTFFPFFH